MRVTVLFVGAAVDLPLLSLLPGAPRIAWVATGWGGWNAADHDRVVQVVQRYPSVEHLVAHKQNSFTTLVVRGHRPPHEAVLDLLSPEGNTFVGFRDTSYRDTKFRGKGHHERTVIRRLHTCDSTRARFRRFTLVYDEETRVHCARWADFVRLAEAS